MINWEVVLWTCITLAVIMGVIGLILTIISLATYIMQNMDVVRTMELK
jgi:hypothetical protein